MIPSEKALAEGLELACQCQRSDNIEAGRQMILELPRAWVLAHIDAAAEPLLQLNDEWEFRRLLELYRLLDNGLTQKLTWRALAHPDLEIQEAGHDFLADERDSSHEL